MQSETYVKEQFIENGVPIKDVEYEKIYTKNGLLVQGHYNNKQFRYIQPLHKNKRLHFSKKSQKDVFRPIHSIERMPIYPLDSLILYQGTNKSNIKNKSKKTKTSKNDKRLRKRKTNKKNMTKKKR